MAILWYAFSIILNADHQWQVNPGIATRNGKTHAVSVGCCHDDLAIAFIYRFGGVLDQI